MDFIDISGITKHDWEWAANDWNLAVSMYTKNNSAGKPGMKFIVLN